MRLNVKDKFKSVNMNLFYFSGDVPPSKSLMNRALIIQQFNAKIHWDEASDATDVIHLKQALQDFQSGKTRFDCADGGTTFRFLAIFLSRFPGTYELKVTSALKRRPHDGLFEIFEQLGVKTSWSDLVLTMETSGWLQDELHLQSEKTSQVASAVVLSSWNLGNHLSLILPSDLYQYGYFQMTLQQCEMFGFQFEKQEMTDGFVKLTIPSRQQPRQQKIVIEPDISSCFPLAVLGAIKQPVQIKNFPRNSFQPDFQFLDIFHHSRVAFDLSENGLKVFPSKSLKAFRTSVDQCPDLFPVLCVFAAFCEGQSEIGGLERLVFKESDRLSETVKLLQLHGVFIEQKADSVLIEGKANRKIQTAPGLTFDPVQDHRMAMAAVLFQVMGSSVVLTDVQVFKKSFPEFMSYVRSLLPYLADSQLRGGMSE